jgi:hypothetical protein
MPPKVLLCGGRPQPLNGRSRSILAAALDDLSDGDANVLAVLARVGLRRAAPAPVEQVPAADTRAAGGCDGRPTGAVTVSSAYPKPIEPKVS